MRISFLISFLFFASSSLAATDPCSLPRNYRDFYQCSLLRHPNYNVSKLKLEQGEAALSKAAQWKNPDLDIKSTGGDKAGEKIGSTEVSLSVPLSQFWLKGNERDLGQAEKRVADIDSKEVEMNVKKEVLMEIYRLRQLNEEISQVIEANQFFIKLKSQYKSRLARGPDQEITLHLVELASADYDRKKNRLVVEKTDIESRLKSIWGSDFEFTANLLPPIKEIWPEVEVNTNLQATLEAQKLSAENEKAQAEHRIAVSESFPDIKAGPTVQRDTEGPNQFWSYGFNVTMTLPLFSMNGGGRKLTESKAAQARLLAEYAMKKSDLDKMNLINKYKAAVDAIRKSSDRTNLAEKHKKIDDLFNRGVAGGSLVIEVHRQIVEFIESQNQQEMLALEAYIELMTLKGASIDEILN